MTVMSKVLVTGSIAYDYVMRFHDTFAKHILPDQLEILNISFTAWEMFKNFGGTAGNIAYNMNLLQERSIVFATVGKDFGEYRDWFSGNGIDTSEIYVHEGEWTASAHVITDAKDNQITAFYGGAMLKNDISILPLLQKYDISHAIVSANGKQGMLRYARELKEKGVPYIYDPGHSIPSCTGEELCSLVDGAMILIVNEYEEHLFCEKARRTRAQLLGEVKYLIVTLKERGSIVYTPDREIRIAAAKASRVVDPTGAGDAYRGGLLKGLAHGLSIETCARIASVAACYKVEHAGTQGYRYAASDFKRRFAETYGDTGEIDGIFGD